jgi:hypothetical protein
MVRLHSIVGSHEPSRAGQAVLSSEQWIEIKLAANRLFSTLEANGLRAVS